MHWKSGTGMLWILALITTTRADTCQVSPDEKEEIRGLITGAFNAAQTAINTNEASILNDWYLGHAVSDVYIRVNPTQGEREWTSLDEVVDPQTGVYAMYVGYVSGATVVFTVGENLEFSCEERNETRRISVVSPDHYAGRFDQGLIVDDNLMLNIYEKQEGIWLLVRVEELVVEHEIMELTGDVSMIERYAVLDEITAYWDAFETSANTYEPCVLNDWLKENSVEEVQIVLNVQGFNWYSLEEVLDYDNGMFAKGIAHFHNDQIIIFIGANVRYSALTEGQERVIQVKAPCHMSFMSDEMRGTDDNLYLYQFVLMQGRWLLKALISQVQDLQVSEGEIPQ